VPTLPRVLMARQPIFDRHLRVVAYELLYRSDDEPQLAHVLNGQHATCNVLLNAYSGIIDPQGIRLLPAFLNLPQQMLESDSLPSISPAQVVFEIRSEMANDDILLESIRRYKQAGYRIALDDFSYASTADELLKLVDIVKLDIRGLGLAEVYEQVRMLKPFKVNLLAEKIETHEQLDSCIELGFQLFQGYFLKKPELVAGRRIDSNEMVLLQLLSELIKPEPAEDRLVELIEQDPSLTFRLLSIVNSAAMARQRKVDSVKEALIFLGLTEVRKWLSLIALSGQQAKPRELTRQILVVAHMCELLATEKQSSELHPGPAFLCGMLDGMDALLDLPREMLMERISVSDTIKEAVATGVPTASCCPKFQPTATASGTGSGCQTMRSSTVPISKRWSGPTVPWR